MTLFNVPVFMYDLETRLPGQLSLLIYRNHNVPLLYNMAGVPGLEPGNPGIKTPCLNQLGYTPIKSSTSCSVLILDVVCARIIPGVLPSTPLGPVSHSLHCSNSLDNMFRTLSTSYIHVVVPANLSNLGIRGALPRALTSLAIPHQNLPYPVRLSFWIISPPSYSRLSLSVRGDRLSPFVNMLCHESGRLAAASLASSLFANLEKTQAPVPVILVPYR